MIPELAHFSLILALSFALVQGFLPLLGVLSANVPLQQVAPRAAIAQLLALLSSFSLLAYSFAVNDFSVLYVAQHSHTKLPLIYRICATWGAHEGSMLLWVTILGCWTASVAIWGKRLPVVMRAQVLVVLAWVAVGFECFILFTSNPFIRLLPRVPLEGSELNPLLQDPGLVSHPPMLYFGYVGFAIAFAFAITALWRGELDAKWANWARPWTLLAWSCLTLGIVLGSWWAYRELGWGGWWFWDPVENASLMPWLAGTALLHSLAVSAKRGQLRAWTVLLAITAFSLSLVGTFLVRSGVLISVHAFAVDPGRGAFVLAFLALVVGGSLTLYAWRANTLFSRATLSLWSRESAILANNLLLTVMMLTVLLATVYPLIIDALHLGKLSVGPPYFNAVLVPVALPMLFLMGLGPALKWQDTQLVLLVNRLRWSLIGAVLIGLFLPRLVTGHWHLSVVLSLSVALWLVLATAQTFQQQRVKTASHWGMSLAHSGVAILAVGILVSSAFSEQREVSLQVGQDASVGAYRFTLLNVRDLVGPNYVADQALVRITKADQPVSDLFPEQRFYPASNMTLAKTAIDVSIFRDLYVALGRELPDHSWGVRLYYKPFVRWIWFGGILMMLGGIVAALDRRYRRATQSAVQSEEHPI